MRQTQGGGGGGGEGEQDPRAAKLRLMCVKEREHPVADLERYLALFEPSEARAIINAGNRNGKTPFHHACQFRASPEAVELLIRLSADIDKATRRGHTALIYACGRGRSQTAETLLAAGANIRVTAVTGDDAISMVRTPPPALLSMGVALCTPRMPCVQSVLGRARPLAHKCPSVEAACACARRPRGAWVRRR